MITKNSTFRNRRGNIFLTIVVIAVLLIIIGLGLVFMSGLFTQQRVEERAEKAALRAARILNNSDRIGQMNNMLAASRELVFNDRENYDDVVENYPDLQPFAKRFLDQSREGAAMMIGEQKNLANVTQQDILEFAKKCRTDNALAEPYALPGLPWTKTNLPTLIDLDLGSIKRVESNVESAEGDEELNDFDLQQKYVNRASHCYYGNITLRLPDPDGDLEFKIAALPAPVLGTIANARLTSDEIFSPVDHLIKNGALSTGRLEQLPSAVQMRFRIDLKSVDDKVSQPMIVTGTAASNGGYPRP